MANRRMFNKELVSSDKFVDMPVSSQLLFFHLGMNADDEGYVSSPNRILRSVGCSKDDMKILVAKNFIVAFESGVIVISEWSKHNQLRKDRFTHTIHVSEKESLQAVDFKQAQPNGNQMATKWQPSIVECSTVENKKNIPLQKEDAANSNIKSEKLERFEKFWNVYNYKKEKKKALSNFLKLSGSQLESISRRLIVYVENTFTDGTFPSRMYPAKYLNPKNELWLDEIVLNKKTEGNGY